MSSVPAAAVEEPSRSSYGRGARLLSIGLALTGLVTFAYFSLASYALGDEAYGRISLLWSIMFVTCSVIYRPIEQLLARTLAARRARGSDGGSLRVPLTIQGAFATAFLVVALALRGPLQDDLFDGSAALYWVLVVGVLAYGASYFARGWLAGNQRFELYGALVFCEATSRCLFAAAVVIGIASGQSAVALGMAAAPFLSLVVVPLAFRARAPAAPAVKQDDEEDLSLARGGRFAVAVFLVMLAEQTLINAAVLIVSGSASAAVAGLVFNALLIARAPLQLFQAVQGALLPHLAGLDATDDSGEFSRAVRATVLAIAGFSLAVAAGLLVLGPWAMDVVFDDEGFSYPRGGLALVALGMGLHLAAGTLNQAALARDHAGAAAVAWLLAALCFVGFLLLGVIDDELLRAEVAYFGAAALLCVGLTVVYKRPPGRHAVTG